MGQVEKAQALIETGPVTFVAAVFVLAFLSVLGLYIRAKERHSMDSEKSKERHALDLEKTRLAFEKMLEGHRADIEEARREHAQTLEALRKEYTEKIEAHFRERHRMEMDVQVTMAGLVRLVEQHFLAKKSSTRKAPLLGAEGKTEVPK